MKLPETPLYKEHTTFNEQWDVSDVETEEENIENNEQNNNDDTEDTEQPDKDEDDSWNEVNDAELTSGVADTMLSSQDFIETNERDFVYNFAPGERNIPVSVFLENDSEEMAFPGIFCGVRRPNNTSRKVKVTYSDIVKSELRNSDRRAANNVENIFFKTKKIQMKTLVDQSQIAIRKVKIGQQRLTAKDVKGSAVTDLIHEDKAYKFLSNIRGSPPYFQKIRSIRHD